MPPSNAVTQLLSNDTKGINLALVESAAGVEVALSKGPFAVDVQDPAGAISYTPGSDDQSTPSNFKANGSGNTGTVTVTVTDTSNGLKGTASFDVVAPAPPPPAADKLDVFFTPAS
jgi:hypothetical protein